MMQILVVPKNKESHSIIINHTSYMVVLINNIQIMITVTLTHPSSPTFSNHVKNCVPHNERPPTTWFSSWLITKYLDFKILITKKFNAWNNNYYTCTCIATVATCTKLNTNYKTLSVQYQYASFTIIGVFKGRK